MKEYERPHRPLLEVFWFLHWDLSMKLPQHLRLRQNTPTFPFICNRNVSTSRVWNLHFRVGSLPSRPTSQNVDKTWTKYFSFRGQAEKYPHIQHNTMTFFPKHKVPYDFSFLEKWPIEKTTKALSSAHVVFPAHSTNLERSPVRDAKYLQIRKWLKWYWNDWYFEQKNYSFKLW